MNVERLHAIASGLSRDLEVTQTVALFQQLVAAVEVQVHNPADPHSAQEMGSLRTQIGDALASAPSNEFSPAWREVMVELGVDHLFGRELQSSIEEIFERHQITIATALEELQSLAQENERLSGSVASLLAVLGEFKIGSEELEPGEFEVGVLIPRTAVNDELPALGKELDDLNEIFLPFSELAGESRPPFKVRSIASSDFSVFLAATAVTASTIAIAVERVVSTYRQLLEIRKSRADLKAQNVSKDILDRLSEEANGRMSKGIEEAVRDLLTEFGGELETGRKNEMEVSLTLSLHAVGSRIDRGYNVEVRAEPVELPDGDDARESGEEGEAIPPEQSREYRIVKERQEQMQFMNLTGEPILSLPEPTDEPGTEDEEDKGG